MHAIEAYTTDCKDNISYWQSRTWLKKRLAVFGMSMPFFFLGALNAMPMVTDWGASWIDPWDILFVMLFGGVGGWFSLTSFRDLSTVLDPFAQGRFLDARDTTAKRSPGETPAMEATIDQVDEVLADKPDKPVRDANWVNAEDAL